MNVTQGIRSASVQLLSMLAFFGSLAFVYLWEIAPKFGYSGFETEISAIKLSLSLALITILSASLSDRLSVRSFLWMFSIYIYVLPALVLFSFGAAGYTYMFVTIIGFALIWLISGLKVRRVKAANMAGPSILYIFIGAVILSIMVFIAYGAHRYFSLRLFDVYLFRRDAAESLPGLFGYVMSPVAKVVLPASLALSVYYRQRTILLLMVGLTVIYFGLSHHKSVLFAPFFVLGVFVFLERYGTQRFLRYAFLMAVMLGGFEIFIIQRVMNVDAVALYSSVILRRVFLIPPFLDNLYVEFFSENPFFYWATSKISFGLISTEYQMSAPFLIGKTYFGNPDMSANSGFIASGFSNGGVLGALVYAMIIGLLIAQLQGQGRTLGAPITIGISLIAVVSVITSTDLITALLTHGLLFTFAVLCIMPRPPQDESTVP